MTRLHAAVTSGRRGERRSAQAGTAVNRSSSIGSPTRRTKAALSFCSARCSICRTRSLLIPSRTPSSSSVRPSSRSRRSRMIVCSRSLSSASDSGQPARALTAVVGEGDVLLRARPVVGQEVLPGILAGRADGRVQRLVAAHQAHFHRFDVADLDRQLLRDIGLAGIVQAAVAAVVDLGAQPAEVEEQRFLRRRRAGADDRPVAQDEVLHGRADPPRGVGREPDVALGLEPGRRLHQADHALLHQIGHRQAIILEPTGRADHETHIGLDQLVQRAHVVLVAPAPGQIELVLAGQERRVHRLADQAPIGPLRVDGVAHCHGTCLRSRVAGTAFATRPTRGRTLGATYNTLYGAPSARDQWRTRGFDRGRGADKGRPGLAAGRRVERRTPSGSCRWNSDASARVLIRGKVQGVWFRAWTVARGRAAGLGRLGAQSRRRFGRGACSTARRQRVREMIELLPGRAARGAGRAGGGIAGARRRCRRASCRSRPADRPLTANGSDETMLRVNHSTSPALSLSRVTAGRRSRSWAAASPRAAILPARGGRRGARRSAVRRVAQGRADRHARDPVQHRGWQAAGRQPARAHGQDGVHHGLPLRADRPGRLAGWRPWSGPASAPTTTARTRSWSRRRRRASSRSRGRPAPTRPASAR